MNKLLQIPPDNIKPNPDNPRLIFRQEEMDVLMMSIARHGVQVPITVYRDRNNYVLLDGERRWRCSKKLNLKTIPALVQDKPTQLQNLLLMSNIHALREQWDYFTIATNLQKIINLWIDEKNTEPNEIDLSEATGLTRGQIRRCNLLLGLPSKFKDMLIDELQLPKSKQKVSEDLFIEMEKSLKTVTKRLPRYEESLDEIRDVLVSKVRKGVISAVTDFRQLGKIATAIKNLDLKEKTAVNALNRIFSDNKINITDTYKKTVEFQYDEKKFYNQLSSLNQYFEEIIEEESVKELDEDFIKELAELHLLVGHILREYK
ncbi:MAG: ParB/RepB/Spo0J family partition protein [Candidatus Thiodiazotropha taylori]